MNSIERRFLELIVNRFQRTAPHTRRWLLERLSADDRELRNMERYSA